MDSDTAVFIDGTEDSRQNGAYVQPHVPGEDGLVSDNVIVNGSEFAEAAVSNGCARVFVKLDDGMINNSSNGEVVEESNVDAESNVLMATNVGFF